MNRNHENSNDRAIRRFAGIRTALALLIALSVVSIADAIVLRKPFRRRSSRCQNRRQSAARDVQLSASDQQKAPMTTGTTQTAPPNPVIPDPRRNLPANIFATFDANQKAQAAKVSSYLSSLQTLVGNFVQVGPDGSKTKGDFYIQKPGKVRFEYDAPSPIAIIADGSSLAVRDRKLATQDIYPLSQTPLRFLLSDRIDLLKDTNVVSVTADEVLHQRHHRGEAGADRHQPTDADDRHQGRPAQAMDRHRPAGL